MTQPRANAELAIKFYSDAENKCWTWVEYQHGPKWVHLTDPSFGATGIYHVGKEAPTEPPAPMCELAGVQLPMPVQGHLKEGQEYWLANVNAPYVPNCDTWTNEVVDRARIVRNIVHLTESAAIQHGLALEAANMQAIERAKERMK